MKTRHRLIVALVVVAGIIGFLIRTAVTQAASFYVTVGELYAEGKQAIHQQSTVNGNIIGSSVQWDPTKSSLSFSMQDAQNTKSLPVIFHGPKPDDFANDWPVIVTGTLLPNGVFEAKQLLIKCPSKYQAQTQPQTKTYSATS